jgi:hypothetical protein
MSYKIHDYSYNQAKKIGVEIKPSKRKAKKIDVYKNGKKVASIGAIGYKDYPTYQAAEKKGLVPKGTAKKKQKAYKARHIYRKLKNTPAYYADKILW